MPRKPSTSGPRLARVCLVTAGFAVFAPTPAWSQARADLATLSLEELMNVEVTSVSRRAEHLADSAASVFVLTSEDIRRSGAHTLPDVLRLVPGMHVAQLDSNKWAVSARGFGSRFSNKLLVMVDGRSVYTPLFSGVFWDMVNVPLDSIERIEVVRGPGATMWGANAVNGVVNIITRSAFGSSGIQAQVGTGTEDRAFGSFQVGRSFGERGALRMSVTGLGRDGSHSEGSGHEIDDGQSGRASARGDWRPTDHQEVTLQGGWVTSRARDQWQTPQLTEPYRVVTSGRIERDQAFGSALWSAHAGSGATTSYVQWGQEDIRDYAFSQKRHDVTVGVQHARTFSALADLVLGAEHRRTSDQTGGQGLVVFQPAARTLVQSSLFAQNDFAWRDDRVRLTIGSKFENNSYTGWEAQPNVRGFVAVSPRASLWAAVSRAVRLPSRGEADGCFLLDVVPPDATVPFPQAIQLAHNGEPARAEVLTSIESGIRWRVGERFAIDASGYRNQYRDLVAQGQIGTPELRLEPSPHVLVPVMFGNVGRATTAGLDVAGSARLALGTRITGGYAWYRRLAQAAESPSLLGDNTPSHQGYVHAAFDLPGRVEFDVVSRYVGRLTGSGVPAYAEADVRVGFRARTLDLAVVGRNLLSAHHAEFVPDVIRSTPGRVERSISLQMAWKR